MPYVCESCGTECEIACYVELEYPVDGSDDHGRVSGRVCNRCAERTARSPAVGRLINQSDAPGPSAGRERHERAADALCGVGLAIESVDLNALLDDDVRTLLDAKDRFTDMTLRYRRTQHATDRRG